MNPSSQTTTRASGRSDRRAHHRARLEMLEGLPARVQLDVHAQILELGSCGASIATIARQLGLDSLVVEVELRRDSEISFLTKREMNRLARGTHIPNRPLRELIGQAVAQSTDLSVNAVIHVAGFLDNSQGRRVLGYAAHADCPRTAQTIRVDYAIRFARALGSAPVEVAGL
jgi:hypothetical protein